MGHHQVNTNEQFEVPSKLKPLSIGMMAIGVLALIYGFVALDGQRVWTNILTDSFFFMAIALGATFFIALNYASEAGWGVALKRVFEAVSSYLWIGIAGVFVVIIAGIFHWHHIYEWMDSEIVAKDHLLTHKQPYLNIPFFLVRSIAYAGIWIFFQRLFRKNSLLEDELGGTGIHFKTFRSAAVFLVLFAVTSSTSAWDWVMSVDAHWYSTLFGWYVFSGTWVSAMIVITILTIWLKGRHLLSFVTEDHVHDLGKWVFAISFLWSYLWFSQFMLIWYSDIPEEVTYFVNRLENYKGLFFGIFVVNFALPMLILMSRDSKRNMTILLGVAAVLFISHWLDVYMLFMPGAVGHDYGMGFLEIGLFIGFLGSFILVVLTNLAKAPLCVKHHPYLEESLHHHQ